MPKKIIHKVRLYCAVVNWNPVIPHIGVTLTVYYIGGKEGYGGHKSYYIPRNLLLRSITIVKNITPQPKRRKVRVVEQAMTMLTNYDYSIVYRISNELSLKSWRKGQYSYRPAIKITG